MESIDKKGTEKQSHFDVVVIGSGFSGLLCTTYLKEAGIENVRVFEMSESVGGVWSKGGVGDYPGAACDVPAYTYLPFLDRTGFIPSKKYVNQDEIAGYAELLTEHTGIGETMRFNRKVTKLQYLGAQNTAQNTVQIMAHEDAIWEVTTVDAKTGAATEVVSCQHVVTANGPLSSPRMPEIEGMKVFKGESFHTAQWDKSASLKGKRVGVIGTGASAAQVITNIADEVESLTVFQRTPTWCLPRDDEPTPPEMIKQFKAGGYSESLRHIDWQGDEPTTEGPISFDALHDVEQNDAICAGLAAVIKAQVNDPELVKLLTPDYPFFCKRALFIDDYYTTYNKSNVTLVHDDGGVVRLNETGLETAGGDCFDLDVVIFATGFDSNFIPFLIEGKNGITLADKFGANESNHYQMVKPHSLWGIHVQDMPNLYMMIGPQSLNPVTNVTLLCEEQSKYIAELVSNMKNKQQRSVEPASGAVEDWTQLCEDSSDGKVWLRCNNWYMKTTKTDAAAGREKSSGMWMGSYTDYLRHMLGGAGGDREELLCFD